MAVKIYLFSKEVFLIIWINLMEKQNDLKNKVSELYTCYEIIFGVKVFIVLTREDVLYTQTTIAHPRGRGYTSTDVGHQSDITFAIIDKF